MQPIDWIFAALPILIVIAVGVYSHHYMKSVADFISGGRVAGRYLMTIAGGELLAGAAVFAAFLEYVSKAGFAADWWGAVGTPVGLVLTIFGFVGYRLRETRAMTLAQFFEVRYSKSFRLFTGILGFCAGVLNFGVIPAIGARFLVYFAGLPPSLHLFSVSLPTYIPLMAVFLSVSLCVTLSGGVITLLVINCIEGILSQVFYLVIIAALLMMFNWSQISSVMLDRPHGQSLMNPFDSGGLKDFNIWFVLMGIFLYSIYGRNAWQNTGAYTGVALTAHEGRMGGILGSWREIGKAAVIVLMGICALTFVTSPDFAQRAAPAIAATNQISNPHIQEQMRMPVALSYLLPVGVRGIFCAILLMGIFGGDATHLQSWGAIFVQDILVPLRKKPFGPEQHIRILRYSIMGVAAFAFLFGCLFQQTDYVLMWWRVTTFIYVGGAGSAIISGLYWKKGTTAAAFTAMITGSLLSVGGILLQQFHDYHWDSWMKHQYLSVEGPLSPGWIGPAHAAKGTYLYLASFNLGEVAFYAAIVAVAVYVAVSLLTCREDFNMDRMLHRGKYAAIKPLVGDTPAPPERRVTWGKLIGIDENFTTGDKWIAGTYFGWGMFWFTVFLIGTTWNFIAPWPASAWAAYWHVVGVGIPIFICVVTGVWFTWGGIRDMGEFYRRLGREKVNHLDDGTVINNQNLDEVAAVGKRGQEGKAESTAVPIK